MDLPAVSTTPSAIAGHPLAARLARGFPSATVHTSDVIYPHPTAKSDREGLRLFHELLNVLHAFPRFCRAGSSTQRAPSSVQLRSLQR